MLVVLNHLSILFLLLFEFQFGRSNQQTLHILTAGQKLRREGRGEEEEEEEGEEKEGKEKERKEKEGEEKEGRREKEEEEREARSEESENAKSNAPESAEVQRYSTCVMKRC